MGATRREMVAAAELWLIDLGAVSRVLDEIEHSVPRLAGGQVRSRPDAGGRRASHIALRILLERFHGAAAVRQAAFVPSAHGKPSLAGTPGDFSLAHTEVFVLAGINPAGAIGVDLEQPRKLMMSASRLEALIASASKLSPVSLPAGAEHAALQAWTRLEALAKADGRGIGWVLEAIGVRSRPAHAQSRVPDIGDLLGSLAVHDVAAGREVYAAVAVPAGLPPPRLQYFPVGMPEILDLLG